MLATLPDALADALGRVVSDVRREARAEIETIKALHRAEIAELKAQAAETIAGVRSAADAAAGRVNEALARVRDGRDGAPGEKGDPGADADPDLIEQMVAEKVAALPPPERGEKGDPGEPGASGKDGRDAAPIDPDEVAAMVKEAVELELAKVPAPKDGRDGKDGESVDPAEVERVIAEQVAKAVAGLPEPERGEPGPQGDPGRDADPENVERLIAEKVAAIPAPVPGRDGKDGRNGRDAADIAGAFRSHDGKCLVTLTDGRVLDLGEVQGKDGRDGIDGKDGASGKDGRDGLSIEDLTAEYDGERAVTLRFARGEIVKEIPVHLPIPLYRGAFRDDAEYEPGDMVTFGGISFIATKATAEKPEADRAGGPWQIVAKKGRDGRHGKDGVKGDPGTPGRAGRDLTHLGGTP